MPRPGGDRQRPPHVVGVEEVLGGERRFQAGEDVNPVVVDAVLVRIRHTISRKSRRQLDDGIPGPHVARCDEGDVLSVGRRQPRRGARRSRLRRRAPETPACRRCALQPTSPRCGVAIGRGGRWSGFQRELVWATEGPQRIESLDRWAAVDDHHGVKHPMPGRRGSAGAAPGCLPLADPGVVGTWILGDVRAEWRQRPLGEEDPIHAGNLPDAGRALRPRWRRWAGTCHDAPVGISDRLLMGPGPSNPYPEVTDGTGRTGARAPRSSVPRVLDETNDRLRRVFVTSNQLTLPVSGTGLGRHGGVLRQLRPAGGPRRGRGERCLRGADVRSRARDGADVIRVEAEWGEPIDPDRLLAAHPSPAIIAVVHAETSTGVRNEVEALEAERATCCCWWTW